MMNLDDLSQLATQNIAGLFEQPPIPGPQMIPQAAPAFAPNPQVAAIPQQLHRGHGLLDRIQRTLTGGDTALTQMGYGDAGLSQQQVEEQRPGLFGSVVLGLAGVSPRQAYQSRLDNIVAHQQAGKQVASQRAMLANREAVMRQFPPPADGSEDSLRMWANKVLPLFVTDPEVSKVLSPLVDRFAANKTVHDAGDKMQFVQTGWGVAVADPKTGKIFDPRDGQWKAGVERGMTGDQLEQNAINTALRNQQLDLGRENLDASKGRTAASRFAAAGGDLAARAQEQFTQALATLEEAATNPAANKSAIINFAGSVDTRAQLRQGTLAFIQNIDPSYKGTVQQWFQTKLKGTLRPDQIAEMRQVIQHIQYEKAQEYKRRYNETITKVPSAGQFIQTPDAIFGDILDTYQPPTPAAPANKSYSPDNPFAKKP